MSVLTVAHSIKPSGPFSISPYWLRRGLQMVVDNGVVVFNRESQAFNRNTVTGGPKSQVSKVGKAMGFGTTYGTGTTDALAGQTLAPPSTSKRSIVAELYPKTTGGGTIGRVFQDSYASGLERGESLYLNSTSGFIYNLFVTNAGVNSTWSTSAPLTLNAWQVFGLSVEFKTSTATSCYGYNNGKLIASGTNGSIAGSIPGSNAATNLVFGNRPSDSARIWDGMQGLILFFDGFLTAQEHATLAANINQIFEPVTYNYLIGGGAYTLVADTAGFALTGQTTGLLAGRKLAADTTGFTLTGQSTSVLYNRRLDAATTNFTLAGQTTGLLAGRKLTADTTGFILTGQNTSVLYNRRLDAATTNFTLAGQTTGLLAGRKLTAATTNFTLEGQTTSLLAHRVVSAATASFILTGQDVVLTYTPVTLVSPSLREYISGSRTFVYTAAARNFIFDSDARNNTFTPMSRTNEFTAPSRTNEFTSPSRTFSFVSPSRTSIFVSASRDNLFTSPERTT